MAGLKPTDFYWVIQGKLALSECVGGSGLTSRKIRREEEKRRGEKGKRKGRGERVERKGISVCLRP